MHLHITLAALARRLMLVGEGAALPHPRGADLVSGLHITVPREGQGHAPVQRQPRSRHNGYWNGRTTGHVVSNAGTRLVWSTHADTSGSM